MRYVREQEDASVEIHHIDGNPANNDPFNLIPLCPNCHTELKFLTQLEAMNLGRSAFFRRYKEP